MSVTQLLALRIRETRGDDGRQSHVDERFLILAQRLVQPLGGCLDVFEQRIAVARAINGLGQVFQTINGRWRKAAGLTVAVRGVLALDELRLGPHP